MKSSFFFSLLSAAAPLWAAPAPVPVEASRRAGDVIPGRFIVQLAPGVSSETVQAHHQQVRRMLRRKRDEGASGSPADVDRVFSFGDFNSYMASCDDSTAEEIARLPDVLSVEPDVVIRIEPEPEQAVPKSSIRRALATQADSPWHLGDISHKEAGATEYVYDNKAGEGMTIYVLDSGVRSSHVDFEGRARFGINGVTGSTTPPPLDSIDTSGHGTHVASTAAGKTYGVAKKAQIVDCKIFNGDSGTNAAVLTALSWAVNDIVARKAEKTSVLSMSFGTPSRVASIDAAVIAAYNQGIVSVVAAGNESKPAATRTPSYLDEVITVGMTEPDRSRLVRFSGLFGSNYGPELDIFAPGGDIVAAGHLSDTEFALKYGTSMATPVVSGMIAYLRSIESGLDTPEQVRARLIDISLKDVVKDPNGSPNRLLYNGSGR